VIGLGAKSDVFSGILLSKNFNLTHNRLFGLISCFDNYNMLMDFIRIIYEIRCRGLSVSRVISKI
jgi:hypothetical protein